MTQAREPVEMVYLTPARQTGAAETAAGAGGPAAELPDIDETGNGPGIDVEAVAARVYRLMQRDLILEQERVTRPGG